MKPWREIVKPHKDVLKGTFQQSEFSADLSTVYKGEASPEYQDPVKFFDRTYITEGMKLLLGVVLQRLAGRGGDPVIELQTNFGGGKTHSLLAVYHLATRKVSPSKLSGIPSLMDELRIESVPKANCAVIDGNSLPPNEFLYKDGDLTIRTLWGLLAWQLYGREGYEMVANSDKAGTSPGKDIIKDLLRKAAPCVILLDELVNFFKQFGNNEKALAGTFDTNTAFIQALTESVKGVDNAVLLASLPQSDIEAGGEFGIRALKTLEKIFGRVESIWKPVATDEGFEIVRRRLFEKVDDEESMNAVCEEYLHFYRTHKSDFPPEVQKEDYLNRMKKSYPIHPEVFDRLYKDWSTLEKFQSTRGVLQYMATVIYQLWNDNNQDALIMPGSIPQAKMSAQNAKYLTKNWNSIVEEEIDGDDSTPAQQDNKEARFGGIQASRRVTRAIFLGSAPDEGIDMAGRQRTVRGLRREQILLGCAIPKQTLSTYDDALARLRDQLHYLFTNGTQYWFDTHPNLRRQMEYRRERIKSDTQIQYQKLHSCATRLFNSERLLTVYIFPNSDEVPEWTHDGLQLVVLFPSTDLTYEKNNTKALFEHARNILEKRGEQARSKRNRIIFLTLDKYSSVNQINEDCCKLLAWEEIQKDSDELRINLDSRQKNDVRNDLAQAKKCLDDDFKSYYTGLLIPKEGKQNQVDFTYIRLESSNFSEQIVPRVLRKLINSDEFIERWNPNDLFELLKEYYFGKGKQTLSVETLWDDFCKYYFYPRLFSLNVLQETIADGVEKRIFGYAASQTGTDFNSFKFGNRPMFVDKNGLIIAPDVAYEFERKLQPAETPQPPLFTGKRNQPVPSNQNPANDKFTRFFAETEIQLSDGTDRFDQILDGIVIPFSNQPGVGVKITVTIEAKSEQPFDKSVIRAIRENSSQLNIEGDFDVN